MRGPNRLGRTIRRRGPNQSWAEPSGTRIDNVTDTGEYHQPTGSADDVVPNEPVYTDLQEDQ